ncbi:putative quinol monooxygenase [Vreelandella sulfidaeris]|uniref:putative quinol monooxygenase n=1 Tax=Vreelandella sulfidaeris TaxID=115553 RepID=UPI0035EAE0C6
MSKNEFISHKKLTLHESGCITFKVIQNKSDACRFDVYEEFIDRAAFEQHQQRVAGSEWCGLTKNAERHYRIDEVAQE